MSRNSPQDSNDDQPRAAHSPDEIERILGLDGQGSIVVKARAGEGAASPGVGAAQHRAEDNKSPGSQLSEPAHQAKASGSGPPAPADISKSDRLKAALARHSRQEQAPASERTAAGNKATEAAIADTPPGTTDDPSFTPQRLTSPQEVTPQPRQRPPPGSEHVKLSELRRAASDEAPEQNLSLGDGYSAGAGLKETTVSNTGTDAASQNPASEESTGDDALRHLPDDLRNRLNSLARDRAASSGTSSTAASGPHSTSARTSLPSGKTTSGQSHAPASGNGGATAATPPLQPLSFRSESGELTDALMASKKVFLAAGLFSFIINLLMLTGPVFMLQVYDRVMTSGSVPTLVVLFAFTAILYGLMGILELARSRVIVRVGVEFDRRIGERVFTAAMKRSLTTPDASKHNLRELDHLRSFLAGPGPLTFFDAPWTPVYLLVIFALHWVLGIAAILGGILLVSIALYSELRSRKALQEASQTATVALELAETGQRNAEAITAMGMLGAYRARWQAANEHSLRWQVLVADRLGSTSAMSKALRLLMQSSMLALGAALAMQNEISAGTIVAATIIFGRALAPVEQAIGQWRPYIRAREAYERLTELLAKVPPPAQRTKLPRPKGLLTVENLRVAAPDTRQIILSNINFAVRPGKVLAVVGPSASGKSTLVRTLVGLWPPFAGAVRLDGARLDQWDSDDLGQHLGYLPQSVELFSGSVKENISRYRNGASDEAVVDAARMAHAHDMIVALPQGYDTQLGAFGTYLSGGQRQRLGLARALFGNPAVIVLDEPNANLDRHGDEALDGAIEGMRKRGQTVVLVSHRMGAISRADLMLYLDRGVQRAFGPRDDVMNMLRGGDQQPGRQPGEQAATPANSPPARAPAGRNNAKTTRDASATSAVTASEKASGEVQ